MKRIIKEIIENIQIFFFNLKRSLFWFKKTWGDRDYDYAYINDIVIYKLELLHKHFSRETAQVLSSEKMADDIKETIDTFRKMEEDINIPYYVTTEYLYERLRKHAPQWWD